MRTCRLQVMNESCNNHRRRAKYTHAFSRWLQTHSCAHTHSHTCTQVINVSPSGSHQSRQEWIAKGRGHKVNKASFYSSERQTMSRCFGQYVPRWLTVGQKAAWQPEENFLPPADLLSLRLQTLKKLHMYNFWQLNVKLRLLAFEYWWFPLTGVAWNLHPAEGEMNACY